MKSTIAIVSFLALSAHPLLFGEQGAQTNAGVVEKTTNPTFGEKITPAVLSEIPSLAQNLRPLRSVSFVMDEATCDKDGVWYPSAKTYAKLDFQRNRYRNYTIWMDRGQTQGFSHDQRVQLDEKMIRLNFFANAKDFAPIAPSEKNGICGLVRKGRYEDKDSLWQFAFLRFYYLNIYDQKLISASKDFWVDSFLRRPDPSVEFEIIRDKVTGEVYVDYEMQLFVIDPREGAITKILYNRTDDKGDKMVQTPRLVIKKFLEKEGYLFPLDVIEYDDSGKPLFRQRIDPSTLEINEEYPLSDFILKIPAGTRMDDHINGTSYVAERPFTLQDIKEIEAELLALVKKAKNESRERFEKSGE
ncbi:MAG: hypothetical protein LBG65_07890 [Puniceicoccales bacterium]|jgi:hypothetical protein|nr:hypothetical protein [Puniceicoccales bacterium]